MSRIRASVVASMLLAGCVRLTPDDPPAPRDGAADAAPDRDAAGEGADAVDASAASTEGGAAGDDEAHDSAAEQAAADAPEVDESPARSDDASDASLDAPAEAADGADGAAPSPPPCGFLSSGSELAVGQSLTSCDLRFTLTLRADGDVVWLQDGTALVWDSQTKGGTALRMQSDGLLILYDAAQRPVWSRPSETVPGAFLALQNNGDLVLYVPGFVRSLWDTGTFPLVPPTPTGCVLTQLQGIYQGAPLHSCNGTYALSLDAKGTLALDQGSTRLWSAMAQGGWEAILQANGRLVVYDAWKAIWCSPPPAGAHPGAYLQVQDNGLAVIADPAGPALWSSASPGASSACP